MRKLRFAALGLALVTLLTLSSCAFGSSAAETTATGAMSGIVSDPIDTMTKDGIFIGSGVPSSHGQNQTRLVHVSSGSYLGVLTGEETSEDDVGVTYEFSIIRVNPSGEVELLYTGKTHNNSSTITMMADKDENVWFYTSWATQSGLFVYNVWEYEVATGEITQYSSAQKVKGGGGKPVSVIDPEAGKIYAVQGGKFYFSWCAFDIATKTWGKSQSQKTDAMYAYTFGYGDGKGGFYIVNERADANDLIFCNIDGMRVSDAMKQYRSRKIDADYMWDQGNLIYVPDANEKDWDPRVITPVVYDVENGVYPNWSNAYNDLIFDEANGLMYVACCYADNGEPGIKNHIFTIDMNDDRKVINDQVLPYLCGDDFEYFHRFYMDAEGNLWLILTNGHDNYMEIWQGTGTNKTDFKLVYNERLPGNISDGDALIAATSRGGSIPSDTAHVIIEFRGIWYYMTIDFAALRERLA